MRTNLGARSVLSLTWLACVALLGLFASKGDISGAAFAALTIASMLAFGFLSFGVIRCPYCGHSVFGVARSRCRVCGKEL